MNVRSQFDGAAQSLLHSWLLFSIGCAAVAGLLSLIVAGARIPAVGWLLPNANMFYVGMVGHVTFGLIIWLLAFVVAVTVYFAAREQMPYNARVSTFGLALATVGSGVLVASVLNGRGNAILTDYVPVLEDPLFFVGYVIFAIGIIIALLNFLPSLARGHSTLSLPAFGLATAVICSVIAVFALIAGIVALAPHAAVNGWNYQSLFWGTGHTLQYVYVSTMVAAWYILARAVMSGIVINVGWARNVFVLYPLIALPAPLAYFAFDATFWGNLRWPGILLDIGLSVPTFLHILIIALGIAQSWREKTLPSIGGILRRPEGLALFISMALYLLGAGLEPRDALGTTRVPAHYHAMVVGGVTTALMGLSYYFLRQMELPVREKLAQAQLYIFGVGVLISVLGLAWGGSQGAPRKTLDAATGTAYSFSMNFMGIGAGLAALGGAIFVGLVLFGLFRWRRALRVTPAVPVVTRQ
jgi:cytochrome c oxidase subunit 1